MKYTAITAYNDIKAGAAGWCSDNYALNFGDLSHKEIFCLLALLASNDMLYDEDKLTEEQSCSEEIPSIKARVFLLDVINQYSYLLTKYEVVNLNIKDPIHNFLLVHLLLEYQAHGDLDNIFAAWKTLSDLDKGRELPTINMDGEPLFREVALILYHYFNIHSSQEFDTWIESQGLFDYLDNIKLIVTPIHE